MICSGLHAIGKQLQNVTHSHPHAADAGTPAALLRIHRDSFKDLHHKLTSRNALILYRYSCLWRAFRNKGSQSTLAARASGINRSD